MVVRLFDPWVGGMERQAFTLARELVRRGVEVEILTGRWFRGTPAREERDGVTITRTQTLWSFGGIRGLRTLGGYLYILSLFSALLRRRRTTGVIHVHGCNYHAAVAVLAGRLTGIPVLVKLANSGRGSDLVKMRRGQQLPLSRMLVPTALRADRFVALNPQVHQELRSVGVPTDRIVHIPNGVEPVADAPRPPPAGRWRLVYVGRLHHQKGLDVLLAAVARIRACEPHLDIGLDVIGEGPEEADLREQAAHLRIDDLVRFHGSSDDVRGHLRAADVFVLPSRAEGLSNALLEALSVGCPAVVSDLPANRVVVDHGTSGLLVPAEDFDQLARAIVRLLEDAPLRARLARGGRAAVDQRFTISVVAGRYLDLYQQLRLGERAGRRAARIPPRVTVARSEDA